MLRRLLILLFVCGMTLPATASPVHYRCGKHYTLPLALAAPASARI